MNDKNRTKKIMPVSKRLIKLIENDAKELAEEWLKDV